MGGNTPKVKAPTVKSAYGGVTNTSFNTPFASATSGKSGNGINTSASLAPELAPLPSLASAGIGNNLKFLNQDPQQQIDYALGGNNPMYNLLQERTKRLVDESMGRAAVSAQGTGNTNSTALGATNAGILNDSVMRQNQNLFDVLNYGNEQGRANLGSSAEILNMLNNFTTPLASAANNNLLTAFNAQDTAALQNAQMQLQADLYNAQAAATGQQNKAKQIGSAIALAGSIAAAPFTGGASLLAAPAALGGSMGGMSSAPSMPNYTSNAYPTNPSTGLPGQSYSLGQIPLSLSNTGAFY